MGWKPKGQIGQPSSSPSQSKAAEKKDSRGKPQSLASVSKPQSLMSLNFPSPDTFSHPSEQFRKKICPDPDSFLPIIDRLCSTIPMSKLESGPKWRQLSQSIVSLYNDRQQERKVLQRKIELWKELYKHLHTEMDCGIFVTGSTFNGFGSSGCDMDMCLVPEGARVSEKQWLTITRTVLRKKCRGIIRGDIELVPAKVPILKFYDMVGKLEVDLCVNNPTATRNTHLLYCYSQLDWRVRPLVLALKVWAKRNGINEARFQTLSSYCLSLMMIHFLQVGVSPPVLPCLHRTHPEMFNFNSDIFSLDYLNPPEYKSANNSSVGQLFVDFFYYFTDPKNSFDTDIDVGSVRTGSVLKVADCQRYAKANKIGPGQWSAKLLIEEPFDRTNAARAVCSEEKWYDICETFNRTTDRIERSNKNKLSLQDLC